jgi:hypothetical protein
MQGAGKCTGALPKEYVVCPKQLKNLCLDRPNSDGVRRSLSWIPVNTDAES